MWPDESSSRANAIAPLSAPRLRPAHEIGLDVRRRLERELSVDPRR